MINWRSLRLLTCLRVGLPFCGFSWAAAFPPSGHLFEWEAVVMGTSSWHWPLSSSPLKSQEKSKETVSWQRRLDPNSTPPLPLHLQCPLYCAKEGDGELRFAGEELKLLVQHAEHFYSMYWEISASGTLLICQSENNGNQHTCYSWLVVISVSEIS